MCQEQTSKKLWMNEVWQNCANGVFVEIILSVLCIFLLCLNLYRSVLTELSISFSMTPACSCSHVEDVSLCSGRVQTLRVPLVWEAAKYNCLESRKQNIEVHASL